MTKLIKKKNFKIKININKKNYLTIFSSLNNIMIFDYINTFKLSLIQ